MDGDVCRVTLRPGGATVCRRRFLRTLAAGGVAAAGSLLVACQATQTTPTAAPGAPPTEPPKAPGAPPVSQATPGVAKSGNTGPVKLGVLLPFSQVYAQLGADILDAMTLYFESVGNAAGGRQVEILREDEGVDPAPAVQKVRKLIEQDQIELFTGIVSTPISYGARDLLHTNRVVSVISNAGGNELTRGRKSPYLFRTSSSAWQVAFPLGEWIARNLSKKVVITAADYGYGRESAAAFKESYERHGGIVLKEIYPRFPTTDYAPHLPEIQAANPEATYNFYSGSDAVNFVKQYDEFGLKKDIKLTGSGFLLEEDVLPAQGSAAVGGFSSLHWAKTLDNPENKKFVADWRARYGREPSVFAVQGYDAARVIVEALNQVNGNTGDRDALVKAMEGVKFASPRGPFEFDPETHNVINPMYLREVQLVEGKPGNMVIETLGTVKDPTA